MAQSWRPHERLQWHQLWNRIPWQLRNRPANGCTDGAVRCTATQLYGTHNTGQQLPSVRGEPAQTDDQSGKVFDGKAEITPTFQCGKAQTRLECEECFMLDRSRLKGLDVYPGASTARPCFNIRKVISCTVPIYAQNKGILCCKSYDRCIINIIIFYHSILLIVGKIVIWKKGRGSKIHLYLP